MPEIKEKDLVLGNIHHKIGRDTLDKDQKHQSFRDINQKTKDKSQDRNMASHVVESWEIVKQIENYADVAGELLFRQ